MCLVRACVGAIAISANPLSLLSPRCLVFQPRQQDSSNRSHREREKRVSLPMFFLCLISLCRIDFTAALPFWDFGRVSLITEIDHGDSNRRLFFCGPGAGRHIGALYVQVEMSGCRSSRERGHHCCALLSVGPDTTTAAAAAPALLWFWRQTWIFHSS